MKEIEIKILEINKNEIIKKLNALGAKKSFEGEIRESSLTTLIKN